jgi:NAD-dependent SIR2 family protein deacetylase
MKGKNKIMILTGAGISAASGIPTFRGENGFWTKSYGNETDPMKILTKEFFNKDPVPVWQWHWDFIELAMKKKVNDGHRAVRKLQEFIAQQTQTNSK